MDLETSGALQALERRVIQRIDTLEAGRRDADDARDVLLRELIDVTKRSDRRMAYGLKRIRLTTGNKKPADFMRWLILVLIVANIAGAIAGTLGKEGLEIMLGALGMPAR